MSYFLTGDDEDEYAKWRKPTEEKGKKKKNPPSSAAASSSQTSSSSPSPQQKPQTFEEFYTWLLRRSARRKLGTSQDPTGSKRLDDGMLTASLPECQVCASGARADVRQIARSCQKTRAPCEGHSCRCVETTEATAPQQQQQQVVRLRTHPCCSRCLAQVLWNGSNELMRSQGRFRGHCPMCKAEFCAEDILLISTPTDQPDHC